MTSRQRNWVLFLLAWIVFSFAVASYHPPRTLADQVLVRAGRYASWRFDARRDALRLLALLVPGLALGGTFLRRSGKPR